MKRGLEALAEFANLYRTRFLAAWSIRHTFDPPERPAQVLAFLPAYLELVETPESPAARWTMRIIMALFCVALLWAILGRVEIVAEAPGKIVASGRAKIIQPVDTAVVKRILVRDGQSVRRGDLLIEFDPTMADADLRQASEALGSATLAQARYSALALALETGASPTLSARSQLPADQLEAARRLVISEFAQYRARSGQLQANIAQRLAEARTVASQIQPLEERTRIALERSTHTQRLLKDGYLPRHEYLLRWQERVELEQTLAAQKTRLEETRSAIESANEELRVLIADTRSKTLDGLRQACEQVAQQTEEVRKARQRMNLMQLRAPVNGTVQQLAVHTTGGVVTPAQPLLTIAPTDEPVEVAATVLNKDIGFVRPGQQVAVKVESFPYTRYGYLEGVVESVSHDAIQDETLGPVFQSRVQLDSALLLIDGISVAMTPGMTLVVEIKTGTRRIIDYLLSPLEQHRTEAMRER